MVDADSPESIPVIVQRIQLMTHGEAIAVGVAPAGTLAAWSGCATDVVTYSYEAYAIHLLLEHPERIGAFPNLVELLVRTVRNPDFVLQLEPDYVAEFVMHISGYYYVSVIMRLAINGHATNEIVTVIVRNEKKITKRLRKYTVVWRKT